MGLVLEFCEYERGSRVLGFVMVFFDSCFLVFWRFLIDFIKFVFEKLRKVICEDFV